MNVLIVDDEPIAQDIIEKFCNKMPYLKVMAKCDNAIEALQAISERRPDLIFLDIQMPELSGMDMLRLIKNQNIQVIMTTAFSEHALESYDYDVTDYLLKPVAFERFVKAVTKARQQYDLLMGNSQSAGQDKDPGCLFVKTNGKLMRIHYSEIIYLEAIKDYIKIYLRTEAVITYATMKSMETLLPADKFIRIHNSFIIATGAVKALTGNMIELNNGAMIPLSKNNKDTLLTLLQINKRQE